MEYILVLAVVVIFIVFKDRPIMVLKFENGELTKTKGDVPTGFQTSCKEIAHKTPFSGQIKVYKNRFTTKIDFSKIFQLRSSNEFVMCFLIARSQAKRETSLSFSYSMGEFTVAHPAQDISF